MKIDKRKLLGFIIGVLLFAVSVASLTFAYYNWKSDNTDVSFVMNDSYFYCESDIEIVTNSLVPVLDYRNGSVQKFKVNNIGKQDTTFSVSLNITNIDSPLKSTSFKYKLVVDMTGGSNNCITSSSCSEVENGSGDFSNAKVGMNTLVSSIALPNNSRYEYYLFMYIDGNVENDVAMQGSEMTSTLGVCEIVTYLDANGGSVSPSFIKLVAGTDKYPTIPTPTRSNSVVTYIYNGATGGNSIASDTVDYTFDGWYKDTDTSYTNRITEGSNLTDTTNHTLKAKWTASKSVTLPTPTRAGYTFAGWYSDSDFNTKIGNAGATYNPRKSITLYAKWVKNTYTIAYTYNGGTEGTNAPPSGTYDTDVQISNPTKTVTVTGNVNGTGATVGNATKKDQTFSGWTSSSSAGLGSNALTGTAANPSTAWSGSATKNTYFRNLRDTSGTVTLTANWTPVAFNLPTVTKDGYTCGWNTSSSASTIQYASGASYTPSDKSEASITMHAVCLVNKVTITINKNGSAWSSSGMNVALYSGTTSAYAYSTGTASGSTVTWTGVKNGTYNIYAGKNSGATSTLVDTGVDVTVSNGETSASKSTATINYYVLTLNKGTGVSSVSGAGTYLSNQTASISATVSTGYTFSSWSVGSGNTPASTASASTTVSMSKATTLTANAMANTYTIAYSCNGGSCSGPTTGTYDTDVQISNPTKTVTVTGNVNGTGATVGNATKKDQTFSGWTSSSSAGLGSNALTGTAANPSTAWSGSATKNTYFRNLRDTSGTVTLTANWTPVAFNLPTVTKDGYTCGWNTSSSASTIQYASGASYTPSDKSEASITMHAVCLVNKVTITINKNGSAWSSSGMNVALYSGTTSAYAYSTGTASGSTVTWTGVKNGTYNIYAGKNSGATSTLVDTGVDVTVSNGETSASKSTATINYYVLTLNKGTGVSSVSGAGTYLSNQTASISAVTSAGYKFSSWSVGAGNTPASTTSASTTVSMSKETTLSADATETKVYVSYNANGGLWLDSSSNIVTGINSNGDIMSNDSIHYGVYAYNETGINLPNWDNAEFINVYKAGHIAMEGAEWIKSGTSTTFDDKSNSISASDLCDATNNDCYVTLKVNWTRFSCGSSGSTINYAKQKWTVISNDGSYCELALNSTSNSTGSYNNASSLLTTEFFSSTGSNYNKIMEIDKNAGYLSTVNGSYYIDSNGGTTGSKPSGIYWIKSGKVYDSSTRYSYTCENAGLYAGVLYYHDSDNVIHNGKQAVRTGCFAPNTNTLSPGTRTVSNTANNLIISNGSKSSSQVTGGADNKFSYYMSSHMVTADIVDNNDQTRTASTSIAPLERDVYQSVYSNDPEFGEKYYNEHTGIQTFHSAYQYYIITCGGDYSNQVVYKITAKSSTQFIDNLLTRDGQNETKSYGDYPYFYDSAGTATSTDTTITITGGASRTRRTWDYYGDSRCKTFNKYTISDLNVGSIYYRPRVRVVL